jgi:hypothetical protein
MGFDNIDSLQQAPYGYGEERHFGLSLLKPVFYYYFRSKFP